ncbi:TPA: hypothetical protein ACOENK_000759 [Stenotrophomonas maltophilia]|uniref:hypothetical protein n=1 Tax=Stenotrophomonas maltophilia TaxID=40324 RepID=UPI00117F899F|nr:hypothetical protein [Stenotrophomonas maltophilia]HDS1307979.1 hypothetical protein [Stenotrophomonas maltophilia]HDS1312518.1 hypothetical protein [Stenotrophomonas maltophilia]HDS1317248.1 hypothetical protein [Stenotrophomonas maltophilia]HDS1442134.1 hypothetical protein [Stenotrophomonas maltophilia]HDS1570724.1 hypothetical protein [Stenotrophomonas maltophilia]
MQARKLTLVEIGVGGLPSASPVAPRFSTWFPVPFKAPDVPPTNEVSPTPVADGVVLEWDAVNLEGVVYVISRSESQDGPWTEIHRTTETRYVYSDGSGKTWWFQITPTVRGKAGAGTVVGAVPPTTSKDLAEQQAKLAAEISARIQAIADEAAARAAGLAQAAQDLIAEALLRQQGVTEVMQAISAEAQARIDAILNEKLAREAAITQEQQLRQSADESLARSVSEVAAGSGTQFDSIEIWPFNQTTDGWTGNGAPTLVDGWLRPANHATAPWVQSPVALAVDGSAYRFVKLRVKRVGSPAWGGSLQWITTTDQAWSTQKLAVIPEPAWDASGVATVDVQDIAWWPATVDAIRLQLGTEQSVANYFLIDYVAVGRPQPGASVAVVQAETEARISADAAEAAQRNTLAVQIRGNYTGSDPLQLTSGLAYEELKARVAADAAQVRRISTMEARMPAGEGALATAASVTSLEEATATTTGALAQSITTINASLPAIIDQGNNNAQAISDLSTKVTQHDETITSQAGLITALRSDVTDLAGTTAANTTALQQLTTRVTTAEDKIETTSQQITQLQTGVDGVNAKADANSAAIQGLTATVTQQGQKLEATAQDLTSLKTQVGDVNATAFNQLQTTVIQQGTTLDATAQDLTQLRTQVGDVNATAVNQLKTQVQQDGGKIDANAQAIQGLQVKVDGYPDAAVMQSMEASIDQLGGGNLLPNATFTSGLDGWPNYWAPEDTRGLTWWTSTSSQDAGVPIGSTALITAGTPDRAGSLLQWCNAITAEVGKWYMASAYASGNRYVQVALEFMDANGNSLGSSRSPEAGTPGGGQHLSSYSRHYVKMKAPPGTTRVWMFLITRWTSPVATFTRWVRPMLAEATESQGAPGPWSAGGMESMASWSINVRTDGKVGGLRVASTNGVAAFDVLADVFRVSSPSGGMRTEYSDGNWRVYDQNGRLRMRWGVVP